MDPAAVEQAKERLEVAEDALTKLREATVADSFRDIRIQWTNFLLSASAIYSKLEQGAKSSGKSAAWFGRMKKLRKDDELLRYIHHARNSDYHGIVPVVREGSEVHVTIPPPYPTATPATLHATLSEDTDSNDFWMEARDSRTGRKIPLEIQLRKYLAVVQVKDDKHGDVFDPPKQHLGEPIEVDEPLGVATLALDYLRTLIAEAEKHVAP